MLHYTVEGHAAIHWFASGVATPSGNLHVNGTWFGDLSTLQAAAFGVSGPSILLLVDMPVISRNTDYCLGPYYHVGAYIVHGLIVDLVVGSTVSLALSGTFYLYCNRYVQGVTVIDGGGAGDEGYMYPFPY